MARQSRYLTFQGQYESDVLGTFRIIRGFANLKDLAEISVAYEMVDETEIGQVKGQQRKLDQQHAERIKRYLEKGERRFLPEVILSVRAELVEELDKMRKPIGVKKLHADDGISVGRTWKSQNIRIHHVTVDRRKLADIRSKKLIRRVDGNHRLQLANTLQDDAAVPKKYLAPFCIILLGPAGETADDYSESLIFHTINSTALPLESEHALKLILGQEPGYDMPPEKEFAYSPDLHFTRLLRDGLLKLPDPVQARLGNRPLTSLRGAVRGLLEMDPSIAKDLATLRKYSKALLAALNDIVTRVESCQPSLCKAEFFIELAARVWKTMPSSSDHASRVNATVAYLDQLSGWLGKDGLVELKENQSLCKQVLDIYNTVRTRIPKKVFLARWYPSDKDGDQKVRAQRRLEQLKVLIEGELKLELIDLGTEEGGTDLIHPKMFNAIGSAEIFLADLTGHRPNVMIELGYALKQVERGRMLLLFEPANEHDKPPFDVSSFRYEKIAQAADIPDAIRKHIKAILAEASAGLI